MKKNAVPSCNLPDDEITKIKEQQNKARLERRQNRSSKSVEQVLDEAMCENSEVQGSINNENSANAINVSAEMLEVEIVEESEVQENICIDLNEVNSPEIDATR